MIFDSLDNILFYAKSFPSLKTVATILKEEDIINKKPGSYKTEDDNCRYNICEYETLMGNKDFEIHKTEADLQIMLHGSELMKIAPRTLGKKSKNYNKEQDISFVEGSSCLDLVASPGYFSIFFPGEPHSPGLALTNSETVKKIVFKLKIPYKD